MSIRRLKQIMDKATREAAKRAAHEPIFCYKCGEKASDFTHPACFPCLRPWGRVLLRALDYLECARCKENTHCLRSLDPQGYCRKEGRYINNIWVWADKSVKCLIILLLISQQIIQYAPGKWVWTVPDKEGR